MADLHDNYDSALTRAAENDHLEIVQFLVESGAEARTYRDFALRESIICGHVSIVDYLASKYIESGISLPDGVISNVNNDDNRILVQYAQPDQYELFHPEIIAESSRCKSARKVKLFA